MYQSEDSERRREHTENKLIKYLRTIQDETGKMQLQKSYKHRIVNELIQTYLYTECCSEYGKNLAGIINKTKILLSF